MTILHAIDAWRDGSSDDFVVFADAFAAEGQWTLQRLTPPTLSSRTIDTVRRAVGEGPHREVWRRLRSSIAGAWGGRPPVPNPDVVNDRPDMHRWFRACGVDLMLYPAPVTLSFEAGVPYVMAIHDLQHRLQPEFPEVSAGGEWERREYRYRNGTKRATLLLADSEVGKEDILHFYGSYGVTEDQVKVLPFLPASYLAAEIEPAERQRVRERYNLPERYLFYPAQFWPHKNHARIVQALSLAKQDRGAEISIVFSGSHSSPIADETFRDVMTLVQRLGVQDQVHYLGYLPNEDVSGMYAGAAGLIMPTFFGPTNIPILEAWALGCPVLTSDIRGIREQVGAAGVLVDPRSVEAIADGIHRLWTDSELVRRLVDAGRKRLAAYTPEDFRRRLIAILEDATSRVGTHRGH